MALSLICSGKEGGRKIDERWGGKIKGNMLEKHLALNAVGGYPSVKRQLRAF